MGFLVFLFQEMGQHASGSGANHGTEALVIQVVAWLKFVIETIAALIIGIGVLISVFHSARALLTHQPVYFARNRLRLSRFLVFALELELAADILGTGFSPTWDEIGKLAAIAVIRTVLNYFLAKEMHDQQMVLEGHTETDADPDAHPQVRTA